jgi:peptidoglycan/xylan/chitin deacetylase (PgdA/CDA1 family)
MVFDLTSLIGTEIPRLSARLFPDALWRLPHRQPVAYLTFDDGPTRVLTGRLLDLLGRYEARATFFLIGAFAARDPGLVRAVHAAGHTVGNHTYTHPDAWKTPASRLLNELERTTALLEDQIQQGIHWMRPPYGRFTQAMRAWCLARRHRLTMWDVMPGDYLPWATQHKVEHRLFSYIRRGSIVVLHDNPKAEGHMPAALETVLRRLRGEGWSFPALQARPPA